MTPPTVLYIIVGVPLYGTNQKWSLTNWQPCYISTCLLFSLGVFSAACQLHSARRSGRRSVNLNSPVAPLTRPLLLPFIELKASFVPLSQIDGKSSGHVSPYVKILEQGLHQRHLFSPINFDRPKITVHLTGDYKLCLSSITNLLPTLE